MSPSARSKHVRTVSLVVPRGVILLDLAVPMQMFGSWPRAVEDKAGVRGQYELTLVSSLPDRPSPWGPGVTLSPLSAAAPADMIVVPGVEDPLSPADEEVSDLLVAAASEGSRIVSICTGAFALAAAGLLAHRRATTHWAWADDLRRKYPDVIVEEQHLFTDNGQVCTSGGVLAGMDLCLHLIRRDHGSEVANAVARFVVSPPYRSGGQLLYADRALIDTGGGLDAAFDFLERNLSGTITIEAVARAAHMSPRTLTRRFRATAGTTVTHWIALRRVKEARRLLETTEMSVAAISQRSGFGSEESMRLRFAGEVGCTPSEYRRTFATAANSRM